MTSKLITILELAGAALVAAAAWVTDPRLGLVVSGLLLVGVGILLERR
jgi:hypothetical protein